MKKTILPLLLASAPVFAGEVAPVMAPPPCSCPEGWTAGIEILGMQAYPDAHEYDNDMDVGLRGSLGYQFGDCMFVRLSGFGFDTDLDFDDENAAPFEDGELDLTFGYVDLVVGQTFGHCDTLTLSPYVGICWASYDEDEDFRQDFSPTSFLLEEYERDFDGFGIVVGIDATRTLGNNFSLYGKAKQSIVFGESEYSEEFTDQIGSFGDYDDDSDEAVFISELGAGIQYDFVVSNVAANVRLGFEGQWWANIDDHDTGLAGIVLGFNGRF